MSEEKKPESKEEPSDKKNSDWILIGSVLAIIFIFALIYVFGQVTKEVPRTLDELHEANLAGKLKADEGYVYNGHSFVRMDDLWHTQVSRGNNLFYVALNFGPEELEDIEYTGYWNTTLFSQSPVVFYTFDPLEDNLQYVTVSAGTFVRSMLAAFGKIPRPACDKNETDACADIPILTCENTEAPLVYFKQEEPTQIIFEDNCIRVHGKESDIVRATDKMMLVLYGIA